MTCKAGIKPAVTKADKFKKKVETYNSLAALKKNKNFLKFNEDNFDKQKSTNLLMFCSSFFMVFRNKSFKRKIIHQTKKSNTLLLLCCFTVLDIKKTTSIISYIKVELEKLKKKGS